MRFLIRVLVSALIIAIASQFAKRSPVVASIVGALPLTSVMILCWFYSDNKDLLAVARLSTSIAFAVIPTMILLFLFPLFIRYGFRFETALISSSGIMLAIYYPYVWLLRSFKIGF